jgi:hypothetical protein
VKLFRGSRGETKLPPLKPHAMQLPEPLGPILCAQCNDAIRITEETYYSVSEYRGRLFVATREVHERCLATYAVRRTP